MSPRVKPARALKFWKACCARCWTSAWAGVTQENVPDPAAAGRPLQRAWQRRDVHGKDGMGCLPCGKAQRKPCRSTKVCGSDLHRPYGTGDTVPKWHTAGCSNTWHGHRFRSDRAVHTVRQKAVLRTQKAVQMVRTHEEPAQGQHPEGGG